MQMMEKCRSSNLACVAITAEARLARAFKRKRPNNLIGFYLATKRLPLLLHSSMQGDAIKPVQVHWIFVFLEKTRTNETKMREGKKMCNNSRLSEKLQQQSSSADKRIRRIRSRAHTHTKRVNENRIYYFMENEYNMQRDAVMELMSGTSPGQR